MQKIYRSKWSQNFKFLGQKIGCPNNYGQVIRMKSMTVKSFRLPSLKASYCCKSALNRGYWIWALFFDVLHDKCIGCIFSYLFSQSFVYLGTFWYHVLWWDWMMISWCQLSFGCINRFLFHDVGKPVKATFWTRTVR